MKAWLVLSIFVLTAVLQSHGDLRFAFIGKTGQGKSTLANAFMGNNETFEICEDYYDDPPCTKNVTEASNELPDHRYRWINTLAYIKQFVTCNENTIISSVRVYVTDTPGWGSNDQETDYETFDQITKCKISRTFEQYSNFFLQFSKIIFGQTQTYLERNSRELFFWSKMVRTLLQIMIQVHLCF